MNWTMGPFVKRKEENPCLCPDDKYVFDCPVQKRPIHWMEKDVFNPAAVVKDGKVYLLFRAEDAVGSHAGTSRIGMAISEDGLHFEIQPSPVFYPDHDDCLDWEWDGGCEDPRIVEREDGVYVMLYTSYDGQVARLCSASSTDLCHWQKHGPVFRNAYGGKYTDLYCKSGSVVTRRQGERFVAERIDGRYLMYFGEGRLYAATSDDLLSWEPVELLPEGGKEAGLYPLMLPRKARYDEFLCEPGPQAIITDKGILLLYNGKCSNPERLGGHTTLYAAGQVLFDKENPLEVLARMTEPFLTPSEDFELNGQVMPTCFIEGLVYFKGAYFLYYGTADSKVAVATCPHQEGM